MPLKQSKTRLRIQEETIILLNKKGLSNVTMRDVAGALNMSPGNLTYHYPKWENLIDDIFFSFEASMNNLYDHFPNDISEIATYIDKIFGLQMKYAFIFSDFYIFFQQFPKYNTTKISFFSQRMEIMRSALLRLVAKDYLYPENDVHDYNLLVKNTWLLLSGWYGFSTILKNTQYEFTKEEFFLSIWNLYVHHLTPRGKVAVRKSFVDLKNQSTGF